LKTARGEEEKNEQRQNAPFREKLAGVIVYHLPSVCQNDFQMVK